MGRKERLINYAKLGKRVKEARDITGLSSLAVATKAQIAQAHYSHVETNNTTASLSTIVHIANALDVTVDSLVVDSLVNPKKVSRVYNDKFATLLDDCSPEEAEAIYASAAATKEAIRSITDKYK